ncbi:hypothetical protein, partial [Streptomyces niveiscabiei]|uniref:hypothetical protein n=1 Tax=Streptomyces niveiscabiei TaxID=164115 RepID=UPI0038F7913C
FVTLDISSLSHDQRAEASILVGGSSAKYLRLEEVESFAAIDNVLFDWGDPIAADVFAMCYEHQELDREGIFDISASTVVGDEV